MGMISRAIIRSLKRAEKEIRDESGDANQLEKYCEPMPASADVSGIRHEDRPLNIQILKAAGGTIVRFEQYDDTKDQRNSKVYVISDDEEFTESLNKIILLEMMKQ